MHRLKRKDKKACEKNKNYNNKKSGDYLFLGIFLWNFVGKYVGKRTVKTI